LSHSYTPYPLPRPLHSFPTRRSSDLPEPSFAKRKSAILKPSSSCLAHCESSLSSDESATSNGIKSGSFVHIRSTASFLTRSNGRSEEHTSELQSLRHLVCRLLLEEKN